MISLLFRLFFGLFLTEISQEIRGSLYDAKCTQVSTNDICKVFGLFLTEISQEIRGSLYDAKCTQVSTNDICKAFPLNMRSPSLVKIKT